MSNSDGTKGPVLIHGITPDDPAKPPSRTEIRDMIKDHPDQWNLYLLGLEKFQKTVPEDMPLSYFKIAGIHGLPYEKWPDQDWNNKMDRLGPQNQFGGFCTHSSILFLTWHRPYLALFEAELYKHVNAFANDFKEGERKADYVKAAKDFRMPYWDWAIPGQDIFPVQAFVDAHNQVIRPGGGKKAAIDPNPLATYQFTKPPVYPKGLQMLAKYKETIRNPTNTGGSDEKEMVKELTNLFKGTSSWWSKKGKNLTERILYILQSYDQFGAASNNKFTRGTPKFENWGSIEDVHNAVHVYTGNGGHMNFPAASAFDPIFWLHHTNIDRLLAIWQACNPDPSIPDNYVTTQQSQEANWMGPAGTDETIDTPLVPFAKSGDKNSQVFWTSADARDTKKFGYVYPETRDWIYSSKDSVKAQIRKLYKTGSFANTVASTGNELEAVTKELEERAKTHLKLKSVEPNIMNLMQAPQHTEQVPAASPSLPSNRDLKSLVHDNRYLEWLFNIRVEKAELGGNYTVHVFLGDPDDSAPLLYVANPSHVGAFATFGQDEDSACGNCQRGRAAGLRITGQIPLTMALVERYLAGLVDGLTPEHAVPYLQRNLHWRVVDSNGGAKMRSDLNNLLVTVVTNEVTVPSGPTELPRYSDSVVVRPEVTTNRDGEGRGSGTGYSGGGL
ncbi:Di-copper centre-containing protein [Xylariaceae sp. FL0016]|nr:Di-copper centre-containing protein [Xylariaceae sp. FL0016]